MNSTETKAITITFDLEGASGTRKLTAILDSGYGRTLAMTENEAITLGLIDTDLQRDLVIANGQAHSFSVYLGFLTYDGVKQPICIDTTKNIPVPLVGLEFLKMFGLKIELTKNNNP